MTRTELRATIRALLGESDTTKYTDLALNEWLYEAMCEASRVSTVLRESSTVTLAAETAQYPLPPRLLYVRHMSWDTDNRELVYLNEIEMDRSFRSWRTAASGEPRFWYLGDTTGTFGLYPKPSAAGTVTILWGGVPEDFADDTAQPPFPLEMHRPLAYKAAALALRSERAISGTHWQMIQRLERMWSTAMARKHKGHTVIPPAPPNAPVAAFSATPVSGTSPLVVQFTDQSTNTPTTWLWTFGDDATSTAQNPSHTFTTGTYTVTLTATNAGGSTTATKSAYVTVTEAAEAPVAAFTFAPPTGTAPLSVTFTDTSTGGPTTWLWDFGDDETSTSQHPSHTYAAAGNYTVTLTATNDTGSDDATSSVVVTAAAGGQLWPSVKTWNGAVGEGYSGFEYHAEHYDYINTHPGGDLDAWYAYNANLLADKYAHWLIFNELAEQVGVNSVESECYDYCVTNDVDTDDLFYHLGVNTYIATGRTDYMAYWDAQIQFVYRNTATTNHRSAAWGGTAALSLATEGDCVYFGRIWRFDEVNLAFATAASADWAGVWEYWDGEAWTEVVPTADTTADCTTDGKVTFGPPPTEAQWKRTQVNDRPTFWGDAGVYFLRLRCATAGTTGPVIDTAQGRHYWTHTDAAGNTIPGWDATLDADDDGWAENADATSSAHFAYEARVPHSWAWCQFVIHPGNATLRTAYPTASLAVLESDKTATHSYFGLFLDDMGTCNIPTAARTVLVEYPGKTAAETNTQWLTDTAGLCVAGRAILNAAGYVLGGNTSWQGVATIYNELQFYQLSDVAGTQGGAMRPNNASLWGNWEDYVWSPTCEIQTGIAAQIPMLFEGQLCLNANLGDYAKRVTVSNGSTTVTAADANTSWLTTADVGSVLQVGSSFATVAAIPDNTHLTLTSAWAGSSTTAAGYLHMARDKYYNLAAFMVMQDPDRWYFETWWSYSWEGARSQYYNWTPAVVNDYGTPSGTVPPTKPARGSGGAYLIQSGPDPYDASKTYRVYARDYSNGFVVVRPPSWPTTAYLGASSAVTVILPQPMYRVGTDGVKGSLVSSVSLKNAEAAIFLKS